MYSIYNICICIVYTAPKKIINKKSVSVSFRGHKQSQQKKLKSLDPRSNFDITLRVGFSALFKLFKTSTIFLGHSTM